jgi:hypothetical protein
MDNLTLTQPKSVIKKRKWRLVTNHLNLMYMSAAGMVMPPKSFGEKYYKDSLQAIPGWIPLFAGAVPKDLIDLAISEGKHLKPCVATVNLDSLKGTLRSVSLNGTMRTIKFPDEIDGSEACLLVPAPLPFDWVDSILLRSLEHKQSLIKDAAEYSNVKLTDTKREVDAKVLAGSNIKIPLKQDDGLPENDRSMEYAIAAGGIMAMLFQFANLGEAGLQACRLAFDGEEPTAGTVSDPIIKALYQWRDKAGIPVEGDLLPRLFWGSVNKIAEARYSAVPQNPMDTVLGFLDASKSMMEEKQQAGMTKLADDLRAIRGFGDKNLSEMLNRHTRLFSKVMALFYMRQKSMELVELQHPSITENEYIAAGMLFGARDGWIGLPAELRDHPGLSSAVSHRMAAMAHRISGTDIDLGAPPLRCIPLREAFASGARGWSAKQREAAAQLSREYKWNITNTKISLGKGDYRLVVDGGGAHIIISGEVKAVASDLDTKEFFQRLSKVRVSGKIEKKIRMMLSA